jgi:hypothetical protein
MNGFLTSNPMTPKDMLLQGIKMLLLSIVIVGFMSCQNKSNKTQYIEMSKRIIGNNMYEFVYKSANDSIENWSKNRLIGFKAEYYTHWQLDSLICFNVKKDKCIMSILIQESQTTSNGLDYLYGVKINKKWYFFSGPYIYLPDEMFDNTNNKPLSFEKLHEIAMKQIYQGYLKPNGFLGLGGYEINEDFFQDLTSIAWYPGSAPKNQAEWDAIYLKIVQENWAKRDTTVYRPDQ